MVRKIILSILMIMFCFTIALSAEGGIVFLDEYLNSWDQFAQGSNSLAPYLKEHKKQFESELTQFLLSGDKRAPSRVVFYMIVQIGGGIPLDSELGKAWRSIGGSNFPIFTSEKGEKLYFAGDLFLWWENNKEQYESFKLLEDWLSRDFAKQMVIPMYKSAAQ